MSVKEVYKAIAGALTGGLTALGAGLADGDLTSAELVAVALAVVVGFGIVWGAPANESGGPEA